MAHKFFNLKNLIEHSIPYCADMFDVVLANVLLNMHNEYFTIIYEFRFT